MGERLEGILSEAILDGIAADLGVDPDDMRKHPFFRVLKGQVLLTYPLKVAECDFSLQFTPYSYGPTSLASGQGFVPPAKTIVLQAYLSVDVIAVEKFYYYQLAAGRATLDAFDQGWGKGKRAINAVMYCNGVSGFFNSTGGPGDLSLLGLTMK